MKQFILEMLDSKEVVVYEWNEVKEKSIKGIIQLVHGSCERMLRYDEFAKEMNKNGYIVVGIDQRGHGLTCDIEKDELGYFDKGSELMIDDQWVTNLYIKQTWGNLPIIMIGHSLGSFIARSFAIKYSESIDKLILVGTAQKPISLLRFAIVLAKMLCFFRGKKRKGEFVWKIANKQFNGKWRKDINANGHEWQTKDVGYQIDFINDELMGGQVFRNASYVEVLKIMLQMENKTKQNYMKKSLPILIASGSEDPVGNFAKEPFKLYKSLKKNNYDVEMQTYDGLRHEVLFEIERKYVWNQIIEFIEK